MTEIKLVNSITDIQTNEEIIVELSDVESKKILDSQEAERIFDAEKQAKKQIILDKLKLTAQEIADLFK